MPSNFCLLRLLTWREPWKRQEKRKLRVDQPLSERLLVSILKRTVVFMLSPKGKKSSAFVLNELGPRRVRIVVQ